ncbi:MAG TPA: response regulator [Vicinamibacterales bacterium]|nr:response regulator [Vicinamibacterales bacterium]
MRDEQVDKVRVLVADDSVQVRNAIVRLLQDTFEIVASVATGRELVDGAISLRPEVIVSDLEMPGLTGLAAMKMLRDEGHIIPFVLLTAVVRNAYEWINMGVIAVVNKSDMHVELAEAVQSAAAGRVYLSRGAIGS